jgi:hypothetical protein
LRPSLLIPPERHRRHGRLPSVRPSRSPVLESPKTGPPPTATCLRTLDDPPDRRPKSQRIRTFFARECVLPLTSRSMRAPINIEQHETARQTRAEGHLTRSETPARGGVQIGQTQSVTGDATTDGRGCAASRRCRTAAPSSRLR